MILLSKEEIRKEATKLLSPVLTKYIEESDIAWANLGAKTQLKKVAEWLEGYSIDITHKGVESRAMLSAVWQALLDEAEG